MQANKRANNVPLGNVKKGESSSSNGFIPQQSSKISEDTLQESKRMLQTQGIASNRRNSRIGSTAQKSPYPIKQDEMDRIGLKTFSNSNEIQRYLENPSLINAKNQPTKLIDP
jgi:hypothetical protein